MKIKYRIPVFFLSFGHVASVNACTGYDIDFTGDRIVSNLWTGTPVKREQFEDMVNLINISLSPKKKDTATHREISFVEEFGELLKEVTLGRNEPNKIPAIEDFIKLVAEIEKTTVDKGALNQAIELIMEKFY